MTLLLKYTVIQGDMHVHVLQYMFVGLTFSQDICVAALQRLAAFSYPTTVLLYCSPFLHLTGPCNLYKLVVQAQYGTGQYSSTSEEY